jgi:hypothetical protein
MFVLFFSHERSGFDHHRTDKARSQATIDRLEGQLRELKRKVSRLIAWRADNPGRHFNFVHRESVEG